MLNVPGWGRRERYHIGKTLEEGRGALAKWFYNQGWKIDSRVRLPHPDTPPPKYQVGWHPSGPRSHLGVLGWPVGWMDRYWVTVKNLGPWGMTPIDSGWKSGQGGSLGLGVVGGWGGRGGGLLVEGELTVVYVLGHPTSPKVTQPSKKGNFLGWFLDPYFNTQLKYFRWSPKVTQPSKKGNFLKSFLDPYFNAQF